jgi:hypothetical protein
MRGGCSYSCFECKEANCVVKLFFDATKEINDDKIVVVLFFDLIEAGM